MAAVILKKTAAASVATPATDKVAIYVDSTSGEPSYKDDAGTTASLKGATGSAGDDGADGVGVPAGGTTGQVLVKASGTDYDTEWGDQTGIGSLLVVIDGGGSEIATGVKCDVVVPFACTITQATLLADQSGSIVIDVWKDSYSNFPPTDADSITASAPPTLSSAVKSQDSTLTGWTTSVSAGDTLRFNVDSITTCQRVTLALKYTR